MKNLIKDHMLFFGTAFVIVVLIVLYLLTVFARAWKQRNFSSAINEVGTEIKNIGNVVYQFFAGITSIFNFFWRKFLKFFDVSFRNLAEFFMWFAGTDLDIARSMPTSVKVKRAGFGFLMFIAVTVSAVFAGRMWGDVFRSASAGVCIAILWFFIIWALDRAIVQYMDSDNGKRAVVIARLVMVSAVSYVNTTFISMEIFHTEIFEAITEKKQDQINHLNDSMSKIIKLREGERDQLTNNVVSANNAYAAYLGAHEADIQNQRNIIRNRKDVLIGEVEGRVGSHLKGDGAAAKVKREMLASDSIALAQMMERFDLTQQSSAQYLALQDAKAKQAKRDPELILEIIRLRTVLNAAQTKITIQKADGYSDRYDAMWNVARKTPLLFTMVFLFFFTFESLVILMKLMAGRDNYDEELRIQKEMHSAEHQRSKAIDLQTGLNAHNLALDALRNEAIKNQATNQAVRNNSLTLLQESNTNLVRAIKNGLTAIDTEVSELPDEVKEAVSKEMTKNLLQSVGVN